MVSIFPGQLGEKPDYHGCSPYKFNDESWRRLSYYPARCLGKAAKDRCFENIELPEEMSVGDTDETYEPDAKKIKSNGLSDVEKEHKRLSKCYIYTGTFL